MALHTSVNLNHNYTPGPYTVILRPFNDQSHFPGPGNFSKINQGLSRCGNHVNEVSNSYLHVRIGGLLFVGCIGLSLLLLLLLLLWISSSGLSVCRLSISRCCGTGRCVVTHLLLLLILLLLLGLLPVISLSIAGLTAGGGIPAGCRHTGALAVPSARGTVTTATWGLVVAPTGGCGRGTGTASIGG